MDKARLEAQAHQHVWINDELVGHADAKWDGDDLNHTTMDDGVADWWQGFVMQYLHRARVLGVTSPLGRQALQKALVTMFEYCVTAEVAIGPPPTAGLPSGALVREPEPADG